MEYKRKINFVQRLRNWLTFPFIIGMFAPLVFLDFCIEIYHRISFVLYGLPRVKRSKYLRIDRHKLKYLRWYEKFFCTYCGYGNGLLRYAVEIASRTEKYWCGIKHHKEGSNDDFLEPEHHSGFVDYNDKEKFEGKYRK